MKIRTRITLWVANLFPNILFQQLRIVTYTHFEYLINTTLKKPRLKVRTNVYPLKIKFFLLNCWFSGILF